MTVSWGARPFAEQLEYFRNRTNLSTQSWTDIWEGMHARAFVVAGAVKDDLLSDLRRAIDGAIADGTTLRQFRQDFEQIVARNGWTGWTGEGSEKGRAWRARTIYETNLRQSYNAGRERQMDDPELRKLRPYGLYRHGGSREPRPEHLAWDGLVLPLDNPWWHTHSPMNGWGCSCKKFALGLRDVERLGLQVATEAPPLRMEKRIIGGREVHVYDGVDPGFAHNPGRSHWGETLTPTDWQKHRNDWDLLPQPTEQQRPHLPILPSRYRPDYAIKTPGDAVSALRGTLGGQGTLVTPIGIIAVNPEFIVDHIAKDLGRLPYIRHMAEALEAPQEVWAVFEQHRKTGKVRLRMRYVRVVGAGRGRGMIAVADVSRHIADGWTFVPTTNISHVEKQRTGILLYRQ